MANIIYWIVISILSLTTTEAFADIGIENNCGFFIIVALQESPIKKGTEGCKKEDDMILIHSLASYETQRKNCQYVVQAAGFTKNKMCTEVPYDGRVELKRRGGFWNECDCITKWP